MINSYALSAKYYDRIFAARGKDYGIECAAIEAILRSRLPDAERLLDVACGTGRHLEGFSSHFELAGIDIDPAMLEIARARLPQTPLFCDSMRDFDLGRRFDAIVCLFHAISYVKDEDELRATLASFRRHLEPGGTVIIEPFCVPEKHVSGDRVLVVIDDPDVKISRMHVSSRVDDVAVIDHHYLIADEAGVRYFVDEHRLRMFRDDAFASAFSHAGFDFSHIECPPFRNGLLVGTVIA